MPATPDEFLFDVFLSHSAKDKAIIRPLAERLRKDGLKVWFDEWVLKPGDSIPAKIEEGLEHSRVLVLCMSSNAFGSHWAQLESGKFRFRDPLNKERRFLPLRLDHAPVKGSLAQFLYIKWVPAEREQEYAKLLEACRSPAKPSAAEEDATGEQGAEQTIQLDYQAQIWHYVFSRGREYAIITASNEHKVQLWDLGARQCGSSLKGHTNCVTTVVWSADELHVISASGDQTLRLWDVQTGRCLRVFKGHTDWIGTVGWSADETLAVSGDASGEIRLWDVETGNCLRVLEGHSDAICDLAFSANRSHVLSGSQDGTIRLWEVETYRCLHVFVGHKGSVNSIAWSADQLHVISGAGDGTIRFWEVAHGRCLRVLEGHTRSVQSLGWSSDQRHALSGSADKTLRLWDVETGRCLRVFVGHEAEVRTVAWSADGRRAFSGDEKGGIRVWDLSEFVTKAQAPKVTVPALPLAPDQVQYTNAKVLLVGESGAGKTGLSKVLAGEKWQPSDSTVGAWATQWKLPVSGGEGVEREIWLWDFGGQADQRLIHQLYMDETALAVLVFDGQKEDVFETLGQWDRDLTRASRKPFTKVLAAGRVDAGGIRISRAQIEAFRNERGYLQFLETSAKAGLGCAELKEAILAGIKWEDIPWRSSPVLFKRLKEEIIRLKDEGRVLMRFNELREALQLRLSGGVTRFTDEELKTVVSLLTGPGVLWELEFGSWLLLQPGRLNAYAQAVIQTMRDDEHERGCLAEERVLNGDLIYHTPKERLTGDEERFVLLAMHKLLVERGLCLREHTDTGTMLIFPSYYRRERPELVGHPAAVVSYRFNGFLDDIYATLVVRLHHTKPFDQDKLWRYAADFKTVTGGKQLGVKVERRAEGAAELVVYADPTIADAEKILFTRYVHEHLHQKGQDLVRLRHYCCPHCGTPVGNREVAMKRLNAWLDNKPAEPGLAGKIKATKEKPEEPTIICSDCEKRVPLWDAFEQTFASEEIKARVRQLQEESDLVLDNESKDRALVGDVISTVALAGQLSREFTVSDHGIDMEIEFKDDDNEATGKKLYLQLKSGDSHLRKRKSDGAEIFAIKDARHARYWMDQAFPVLLVIASSHGEVRWMEVRDWLKRASNNGKKPVKQIVFEGERFDVMSVRRWREKVLSS